MWRTPSGDRMLAGAERRLFIAGAVELEELLRDAIQSSDDVSVGVAPFDNLALERRRWLLLQVVVAACGEGPSMPTDALTESAVMAVFSTARISIEAEIMADAPAGAGTRWRRLAREAWMERCSDQMATYDRDAGYRQAEGSANLREWAEKTEDLADLVLWDRDFELDETMADRRPAEAQMARHALGIDSGYFRSVPEPPSDAEKRDLEKAFELFRCEAGE